MDDQIFDKIEEVDLKKKMEDSYIDSVSYTHLTLPTKAEV